MVLRRRHVLISGLLAAALLAGATSAAPTSAVRATLSGASQPRALAVFTGSLRGQALTWRLTHHGLGPSAKWAQVRVAGTTVRLCAPCAASVAGKVTLTPAAARAARSGGASVDLRGSGATIHGALALGAVPTLQLTGIADGARLSLPATVQYAVTGFRVAPDAGRIVAYNGKTEIPVQADGQSGTITLPDDKTLTGRRDLTFVLADSVGVLLKNREARVRVYDVLLAGRR